MTLAAETLPLNSDADDDKASAIIPCINPATGEALGHRNAASAADVDIAVAKARAAQQSWGQSSFRQRRAVLNHILDHILEHADDICAAVVTDSGKSWENALLGEVLTVTNKIKWLNKYGEKHLKPERVSSGMLAHKKARIEYLPLGVVACIVPWNYPFQNIFGSLLAPLMAGNAVIIKASEAVAWSTERFQKITDEALQKEGFSPDTVQIINGYGETGAALVQSRVDKILFIGSVPNGRKIVEGSAKHLTPTVMELGGKDPMIICDDANLEHAVHSALGGCFINLGQNCIASERVIVHAGIHDAFVAEVTKIAANMRQGNPIGPAAVDVGSLTSPMQVDIVAELVGDAIANGAKAVAGGKRPNGPGHFYPPTVLVDVTPDMRIANEEVFGPVMLIMKVASDEEAIALTNSVDFALQSSIFSNDRKRAEHIASQIHAGGCCINDFGQCYLAQDLPFGGVKYSGFGRLNGRDGLRAYTNARAVLTDRFPFVIPPKLFPVKAGDYEKSRAGIRLMFSRSWPDKFRSLIELIRLSLNKPKA